MSTWRFRYMTRGIVFIVAAALLFGFAVMALWNALIPAIFNGPTLSFWQALGILLLSHLLFRGWAPWRHGGGGRHERWRRRFEEKIAAMTPEEREQFRQEWKHRCSWHSEEPRSAQREE